MLTCGTLDIPMSIKALLHLLNEFAPIICFFVAAQVASFYVATATLIISTLLALSAGWYFERRLPILPIISGLFVIVSGLITLYYRAPDALIFADSLYYLLMGITIGAGLLFKANLLKIIFATTFAMTDLGWNILARRWVAIFLLAGIANEVARFTLSPEEWVHFKFLKVITVAVFGIYQFTLSRRHRLPNEANAWGLRVAGTTTKG
jgi:intracellular septation protein